jgi:WD40 repeat protein
MCWSQLLVDGCDEDGRRVAAREIGVASCHRAVPFEAIDAALDRVALAVVGRIETWRSAATGAELLAVARLVSLVRDGATDPAAAQVGVAFSPDGTTLATSSKDGTVRLWNVATSKVRTTLTGHTDWVYSVAFSPDGKTLATTSADQTVRLCDVATGRTRTTLRGHTDWVMSARTGRHSRPAARI